MSAEPTPTPSTTASARPPAGSPPFLCPDPGFGVLEISGNDAAEFLHGQLSSDVRALAAGHAQYSSYNSAKGRMLANLLLFRAPGPDLPARYGMVLAGDLVDPIRERLARYVLRSKVTLADRRGDWAMLGIAGDGASAALAVDGIAVAPLALDEKGGVLALGLADGRALAFGPIAAVATFETTMAGRVRRAGRVEWARTDIDAGIAWIVPATSDRFVAQMLNWDVIGGISFKKGCYPGQEIIARVQYLGRVKERLLAFETATSDVTPGSTLYSVGFGDQSCGTVAAAAPGLAGGTRILAVTRLAAADANDLHVDGCGEATLTRRPLPYSLPLPHST